MKCGNVEIWQNKWFLVLRTSETIFKRMSRGRKHYKQYKSVPKDVTHPQPPLSFWDFWTDKKLYFNGSVALRSLATLRSRRTKSAGWSLTLWPIYFPLFSLLKSVLPGDFSESWLRVLKPHPLLSTLNCVVQHGNYSHSCTWQPDTWKANKACKLLGREMPCTAGHRPWLEPVFGVWMTQQIRV